jgi:hypothetical protein
MATVAEPRVFHILNLGAGVQSTALYLMSLRQDEPEHVPVFDFAIFADTQREGAATYRHLEWLESLGGPPILIRSRGDLMADLLNGFARTSRDGSPSVGHKSIPAFVRNPDGSQGLLGRHCTQAYKVAVVEEAIKREIVGVAKRARFPRGEVRVYQYFGLSFDEPGRIVRTQARVRAAGWSEPVFPLFALEMTRYGCDAYNRAIVPHPVPRSACIFCPLRSNANWRAMRDEEPDEFEAACCFDEAMRMPGAACNDGLDGVPYLHRSMVPLRAAPITEPDLFGDSFAVECEGMCGV